MTVYTRNSLPIPSFLHSLTPPIDSPGNSMAENNCCICVLGVMDHLWFHQLILFSSEPSSSSPLFSKTTLKQHQAVSESSFAYSSSSNGSQTPLISEEESPLLAVQISRLQDEYEKQDSEQETTPTERPTKTRTHSSSPSNKKRSRNLRNAVTEMKLQKSMSCKSLCELELEEVKGFMDLGFEFKKENLSKRMMSVIPGLQRLELYGTEQKNIFNMLNADEVAAGVDDDIKDEEDGMDRCIIRPYLSEAWLINRPDSPLLNLRIPRVSTAAHMKKHLKYWARTVASTIQQES